MQTSYERIKAIGPLKINYRVFVKADVSYHDLRHDESQVGSLKIAYSDLDLWIYDAGIGLSSNPTKDIKLGLRYKYKDRIIDVWQFSLVVKNS